MSRHSRRGSTLVESALALTTFAILLAGMLEVCLVGFAANSVTFAAQRAARFASVRGRGSGHPAAIADIQAIAQQYASPLTPGSLSIKVTWVPDNNAGSAVTVSVIYTFKPSILPLDGSALSLQSTSSQVIVQ